MKRIINWILNRHWVTNIILHFLSKEKKEKYYISMIRHHFLFFGHDITDLTDDEIKEGLNRIHVFLRHTGISWREMIEALNALGTQVQKTEKQ